MTSKLTREWLKHQISAIEAVGITDSNTLAAFKLALAAMDSEPVIVVGDDGGDALSYRRLIQSFVPGTKLYRHAQQPVVPDESYQQLSELYHAQEKRLFKIAQRIKGPAFDKYSHSPSQAIDVLEAAIFGENEACCAAMLQAGNSPVIPESCSAQFGNFQHYWHSKGYVLVPNEPTEAMCDISHIGVDVYCGITDDNEYYSIGGAEAAKVWKAMLAAAPQPQNAPQNIPEIIPGWIPVRERMPEREYVLAADFSGKHYSPCQPNTQVGIYADWFDDGNPTWDDGDGNDLHLKEVTHWMPLPAAPQELK